MITIVFSPKTSKLIDRFIKDGDVGFNAAVKLGLRKTGEEALRKTRRFAPVKSGQLRRSIDMIERTNEVIIGTNLVYARIQEFGGTIRPKNAKALAFKVNGQQVFAQQVYIPKFKGRGYFAPAFQQARSFGKINMEREINKFLNNVSK